MTDAKKTEPIVQGLPLQVPQLGRYGIPRARPLFGGILGSKWLSPENDIRGTGPMQPGVCCLDFRPGPNIPAHWWDAGDGWVTSYFTDIVPYDKEAKQKGKFRCVVPNQNGQMCNFEVENTECCAGNCCWTPGAVAPGLMKQHLISAHGLVEPGKREWAINLCDCDGASCAEALFCTTCAGSRQIMAGVGYVNTFNVWWCLGLCALGCQSSENSDGTKSYYWIPPWQIVAILTRFQISRLNSIDEGPCKTCLTAFCCPCCSMSQTYNEYTAAGVWPGGTCCIGQPPAVTMKPIGAVMA